MAKAAVLPPGADEKQQEDTLLFQMERKYFCQDEDHSEAYIIDIFGHSPCKAAHERLLELLVLDNLGICRIGCAERLASLARKVAELDLSCNQLDWPSVGQLLLALPQLQTLNLSQNPGLSKELANPLPTASKLKTLILNGTSFRLPTLRTIVQGAPNLRELHLSRGHFPDLIDMSLPATPLSSTLTELHLNDCGLTEWCQVLPLMRLFPHLQSLFLADNPLDAVYNCAETAELTARLKSLSLSNTRINSWESIESLDTMEQLEELRVAHIPLMEEYSPEERLHLVVGRIRSLRILNGSPIDGRQREESERFFIRYYADAEKKPLVYEQLVAEHGLLEQLVKVDLTPKRHAKVSLVCEETDWMRMWIRLRLTGTVQELMKFAERITKIPLRLMRIFYVDKSGPPWPNELRPSQQLKMLHIEDGDEFFVQSKLVPTSQTAASRHQQVQMQQKQQPQGSV